MGSSKEEGGLKERSSERSSPFSAWSSSTYISGPSLFYILVYLVRSLQPDPPLYLSTSRASVSLVVFDEADSFSNDSLLTSRPRDSTFPGF